MNKQQAYYDFWSRFGVLAFEENAVPNEETIQDMIAAGKAKAKYPYITYQVLIDDMDGVLVPTASIWDKNTSWQRVDELANTISEYISRMPTIKLDNGRMYIYKGSPFAQHEGNDDDNTVKRNILNVGVEFLTEY